MYFKIILTAFLGFGSGIVVSGAVFAFVAAVGVVTRLAQKTGTEKYIKLYEEAIIFGGITGCSVEIFDIALPFGKLFMILTSFCCGIFFGCVVMSLAEILDVLPILARRGRIVNGMFFFILSIALGKLIGALLYFKVPGFFVPE